MTTEPSPQPDPASRRNHPLRGSRPPGGFTLVELLVVIAIFVILAVMTLPAFTQILASSSLRQAGFTVGDQLILARQRAAANNTHVELRFIEDPDTPDGYRALQLWELDDRGGAPRPLGRLETLPDSIVIQRSLSPLIDRGVAASTNFPGLGQRNYSGVRFRPNGRLETPTNLNDACITALSEHEDPDSPRNYYTVQINPLTGRVATYQP